MILSKRAGLACALFLCAGAVVVFWLARDERRIEERLHARLQAVAGAPLVPFESDGCSGGLSAMWNAFPGAGPLVIEACCISHDRLYHAGGGEASPAAGYLARRAADEALRACVHDAAGQAVGDAVFQAVRLGGLPCSGLPWRWGYGRPACAR